jgi:hypothetical protein
VIVVGVSHHVTQRGNARRYILDPDSDRMVYLFLLREAMAIATQRCLIPRRRGRRKKARKERQGALVFDRD